MNPTLPLLSALALALTLSAASSAADPVVRDLGIPVKSVSWVRFHPGRAQDAGSSIHTPGEHVIDTTYGRGPEGRPSLLASMGQNNGGLFALDINLSTGACRQFNAPSPAQQYPTISFRSPRSGALYIGSAMDGHLLRYDPRHAEHGLEDLGAIDAAGQAIFPTGIDEDVEGCLWIGSFRNATLTRFDPATGQFRRFGSLDPNNHYLCPLCGADGTVAALAINVRPHMVAVDPATGAHKDVGPWIDTEDKSQYLQFFKGVDGLLYIDTFAGKFRLHGMNLEPVSYLPLEMPGVDCTYLHRYQSLPIMPGGLIAAWADGEAGTGTYRKVLLRSTDPAVPARTLDLDWHGEGSNVFMLHLGSDGMIYGSSLLPEHLFRCAPDGTGMVDLARCSAALGEAYTMANFSDGTMAIASYVDSDVSLYDPRRPYHYGTTAADNPRDIGRLDDVGLRPVAMAIVPALTGAAGQHVPERMWIGSLPYYGTWGGTLAWLDPKTGAHGSHRNLVKDCSPFSLLWLPDLKQLLVGISTEPGTGAHIRAKHGAFALWDPIEDKPDYIGEFGLHDMPNVLALTPAGHGRVYALLGNTPYSITEMGAVGTQLTIALIDPARHEVLSSAPLPADYGPLPHQGYLCLFQGPDHAVYGVTAHTLYRVTPGTCDTQPVWRTTGDDHIDVPGPWINRTFYFGTDWRLRTLTLP